MFGIEVSPIPLLCGYFICAAVVSHRSYWSRHELDDDIPQILTGLSLAFVGLTLILNRFWAFKEALSFSSLLFGVYFITLFVSIICYRLFLHPLKKFPGPFWARLWQWWRMKAIAKAGMNYKLADNLHEQYGDVVRLGPNSLSINSVEALQTIYGSQSTCIKSPQYLIGGLVSVQSERDPHRHRLRRAVWDKALGTNASNGFFPRLSELTDLLARRIAEHGGQDVCVNDWMHYITFDAMSAFIFTKDWNQLVTGKMHAGIKYASDYLQFAVYGSQVPWLACTLTKIPNMPEPQSAMVDFSRKALAERRKTEPRIPDAMTYITSEKDPEAQQFLSAHDLESDVFMIMLAGADTSFSVLINICFRLAGNKQYQRQLREEVKDVFNVKDKTSAKWSILSSAPFLAALINEVLRLHPPVPSGMARITPTEGLIIEADKDSKGDQESVIVPGGVNVSVPTYTLHRSPKYWVDPLEFIPERWSTKPELILDRRAWCPFSLGAYGCAGKYFALMEIKLVIARLVTDFDINFATQLDEEDRQKWLDEQADWMTLQPSTLKLKFNSREVQ